MSKEFNDIINMHKKFGISGFDEIDQPRKLSAEEKEFRLFAMLEELDEYFVASSLEDEIDAIIDLIVFAMGTLERMGVQFEKHWDIVMAANMAKELCGDKEASKRNFAIDLCKPKGWVAPNHSQLIPYK